VRLLLDTHVAIWWMTAPERLGKRASALIEAGDNDSYVSAVTVAEVAIMAALGKLRVPHDFLERLRRSGFDELALTSAHADRLRELPLVHKDPVDRMLVVQAQAERLALVTADRRCMDYDVELVDARR
jgi:PIN domain nuclease of toxin-antitoxin system